MKKSSICFFAMLVIFVISSFAGAAEKTSAAGFKTFYKSLSQAVKSNNRKNISGLMAEKFQWAMDADTVSKERALELMDEYKMWDAFKKALHGKVTPVVDSRCDQGACYAVWSKKSPVGFIFKKVDGQWTWAELRGD